MDWDIEEIVASSDQLPSQTDINTKLASLKPKLLSALIDNSYLNQRFLTWGAAPLGVLNSILEGAGKGFYYVQYDVLV